MTDSEKLDLLLTEIQSIKGEVQDMKSEMQDMKSEMQDMKSEVQGMKSEMQDMKSEMQDMKSEMQNMKSEMQDMKSEMQNMKSEMQNMKENIDKLSMGQLEIKKEIYMLNRKISDTYNVALDALGTSAENRTWLEKGALIELCHTYFPHSFQFATHV